MSAISAKRVRKESERERERERKDSDQAAGRVVVARVGEEVAGGWRAPSGKVQREESFLQEAKEPVER